MHKYKQYNLQSIIVGKWIKITKKKHQEIKEDEEEDNTFILRLSSVWNNKKYTEEKIISEKSLIKALKVIFEENTFWD